MLLLLAAAACTALPTVTPADAGFPPDFAASVTASAREADTDSLLILKDGKVAVSLGPDKRLNIYSVTKAVTSLLAGRLFTTGAWRDVDAPLSSLLPEFAGDPKGAVTLRQIMSHTSGIADARDANGRMSKSWNESRDWRAEALKQPMRDTPGTVYRPPASARRWWDWRLNRPPGCGSTSSPSANCSRRCA